MFLLICTMGKFIPAFIQRLFPTVWFSLVSPDKTESIERCPFIQDVNYLEYLGLQDSSVLRERFFDNVSLVIEI